MYNKNIFIADDDKNLLEIYESILTTKALTTSLKEKKSKDFIIKTFVDGQYLFEYFKIEYETGNRVPLCILDMKMPRMDGLETARSVRVIDPDVIIIIVTAYEDITLKTIKANLEKDIYYIKKPFNKEELYCLVDSLIKGWNKNLQIWKNDKALRESQEMLQLVLDSIPARVFWKDKSLTYLGCNRLFAEDAGLSSPEEIVDRTDYDLPWKKKEADFFRDYDLRVIKNNKPEYNIVESVSTSGGKIAWISTNKMPIHNNSGEVVGILGTYEDITKKVQTQEELRKSEQKLSLHFQQTPLAVMEWNLDFEFTVWNPGAEKIFGFTKEEVLGRHANLIIPEDERGNVADIWISLLYNKGGQRSTNENITKDGRRIICEWYNTPLVDDRGNVLGVSSLAQDITARTLAEEELKQYRLHLESLVEKRTEELRAANEKLHQEINERIKTEEELRKSEKKYRQLFNEMLGGFALHEIICNEEGKPCDYRFLEINPAFEKFTGVSERDVIGKTVLQVMPETEGYWIELYGQVALTGKAIHFENYSRELDKYFEVSSFSPEKGRFAVTFTDITERRHAEIALKKSEEEFRKLSTEYNTFLEAIPDILLVISSDMTVIWANNVASERFGGERNVLNNKCYTLMCNSEEPHKNCPIIKSFSTGKPEKEQVLTADSRYLDIKVNPIKDEDGKINKIIVVASDVTEKVIYQKEAIRTSHLASLGELAAGVAHEINNPINGIINYAQIIIDEAKDESQKDVSEKIIKEGRRIAVIVRNLLSFARREVQDKKAVRLYEILAESLSLTGLKMAKDGIKIKENISPQVSRITGQPVQLQQVFMNILINARDALNKKYPGKNKNKIIEVTVKEFSLNNFPAVQLVFKDYGSGIPSRIIDKVMNPFFSTKPPGEGTGLGLSISYGIITDHKGQIYIDSVEGEFTKVIINLPAIKED